MADETTSNGGLKPLADTKGFIQDAVTSALKLSKNMESSVILTGVMAHNSALINISVELSQGETPDTAIVRGAGQTITNVAVTEIGTASRVGSLTHRKGVAV